MIRHPVQPQPGPSSRAVVETVDISPTLTELGDLPAPANLDGQSLRPQLAIEKVSGTVYRFLGLPWGRRVLSRPSRMTTCSVQAGSPNGLPRVTHRRRAVNSASDCGALTWSIQLDARRTGQGDSKACSEELPRLQRQRLPHRQSSARVTRFARKALRSTYRQTVKKCSSSWTGKDLNRPWYTCPLPVLWR
jgi:hypothetical protein